MLIRCALLSVCLLGGSVLAGPPAQTSQGAGNANPGQRVGNEVRLPGGVGRIPAGAGTTVPPAQANPTHHVRRQDALRHAQGAVASREQMRGQAAANAASAP